MDPDRQPVRMRGTCIDITDRVLADAGAGADRGAVPGLVDVRPRRDPRARRGAADRRAATRGRTRCSGATRAATRSREILPPLAGHRRGGRSGSPARRPRPGARRDHRRGPRERERRRRLRGALPARRQSPGWPARPFATRLGEAHLRRRQALEINDNVVQGLVAAAYALDQEQTSALARLSRPDALRRPGDDGRPARAPRRRGTAARRPGPHRPGGDRRARPTPAAAHLEDTDRARKTPTGSSSSTTPRTCGCCCARGWSRATD